MEKKKIHFKNSLDTNIKNIVDDELKGEIKEVIDNVEIRPIAKFFSNLLWVFLLMLFVSSIFVIVYVIIDSPILLWCIAIFNVIIILTGFIVIHDQKSSINKTLGAEVSVFQKAVENIDNIFFKEIYEKTCSFHLKQPQRGPTIPGDARWLKKSSYVVVGSVNGNYLEIANDLWRWTRSNGKSSTTYYRYTSSIIIINEKLKEYNGYIRAERIASRFSKKKGDHQKINFSIDDFNKHFDVYGDPVKMRKLFNATEMDKYLKLQKKKRLGFSTENRGSTYICSFVPISGFMKLNTTRLSINKEKIFDAAIKDIEKDLGAFLHALSFYTTLRKLN